MAIHVLRGRRFTFSVDSNATEGVRLTGLGFSMVSDNTFGGLNTTQVHAIFTEHLRTIET